MRLTEFVIVTLACVFFLFGTPLNVNKKIERQEEQAQEEEEIMMEKVVGNPTYKITFHVRSPQEEAVACRIS